MDAERMLQAAMTSSLEAPALSGTTDEDRRLAVGCAAGDSRVFEEIYNRLGDRMKSIAWNHLGNIPDAEDAVQEAFLKIHRSAATFTGEAPFSSWAFRILVNTCYDLLRRRRRRITESSFDDAPETAERTAPNVDDAKRIMLRKMLDDLPEQRRTVFTLFEIEGLSHAEIGEILGISEGNSKWILFATKKELQEKWKQSGRNAPDRTSKRNPSPRATKNEPRIPRS